MMGGSGGDFLVEEGFGSEEERQELAGHDVLAPVGKSE